MSKILNEEIKSDFWKRELLLSKVLSSKNSDQFRIFYNESSKGYKYLTIRKYYLDGERYSPTRKGLSIPLNEDLIESLEYVLEYIKENKDKYVELSE